jgi:hypothetical protein
VQTVLNMPEDGFFSRLAKRFSPAPVEPLSFDGVTCPVREHTGDGAYVGRCDHSIYGGYCPRHGLMADYLREDGSGDDRDFPEYGLRTWPQEPAHRLQLGVNEGSVKLSLSRR